MIPRLYVGAVITAASTVLTDVFTVSLGDMTLSPSSTTSSNTLSGTVLAWSAPSGTSGSTSEDGIHVSLSSDLVNNLESSMEEHCKAVNSACYDEVRGVLLGGSANLQTRNLGLLGAAAIAIVALLADKLISKYQVDKTIPQDYNFASTDLQNAASAATASTIALQFGTSKPYVTITQGPQPTSATGTAPVITTFSQATGDHAKGDVNISVPSSLANRVSEIIARNAGAQCDAGSALNKKFRKRAVDFGPVLCSSEDLMLNMQAALQDLLLMLPGNVQWAASDAVRALNAAKAFARSNLPNIDPNVAIRVANTAFMSALAYYMNNGKIGLDISFPANLFSSPSDGCPVTSATQCYVSCSQLGGLRGCETACEEKTSCSATSLMTTTTTVPWTVPVQTVTSTGSTKPWCLYGAAPRQTREPKSYCQCGDNHATMYSVASGGTPCPYNPTSHPSQTIVFSTPSATSTSLTQASPTATPGPDGKSTLSNKSCRANSASDSPTMYRDEALNAVKELCKKKLRGDKNGCIQYEMPLTDKPIYVQAWVYQDRSGRGPCMLYPFNGNDYKEADNFEAMCKWALQSAIDDCDTSAKASEKRGGSNQANCINYTILRYNPDKEEQRLKKSP